MNRLFMLSILLFIGFCGEAHADAKAKAAREAAEYLFRKFGKEAVKETIETASQRIESLAVKYGDDAFAAVKNVGPRAFRVVEVAGDHGPHAIKLMARRGDNALWIVEKKNRLAIFVKYGDEAAESMIKHRGLAEPLIQSYGQPAAGALNALSKIGGRRLATMADEGDLSRIGRTKELLEVVRRHGDAAMNFIWDHKGPLMVGATLAAFLADPEPFIQGAADLSKPVLESVVQPLVSVPGQVAVEAAKAVNWTLVIVVGMSVLSAIAGAKLWLQRRSAVKTAEHSIHEI